MKLSIDGQVVDARPGDSILEASLEAGIYIPAICYHPDLPPFSSSGPSKEIYRGDQRITAGVDQHYDGCGLCAVTVETQEDAVLSCETPAQEGMIIHTNTEPLRLQRKKALARVLRDHPRACLLCAQKEGCSREPCSTDVPKEERCCPLLGRCELEKVADFIGTSQVLGKYEPLNLPVLDEEPLFRRDYNLCIGCTRCVRACNDLRGVEALGYVMKDDSCVVGTVGAGSLTDAGCRLCGACVEVCPTGALIDKRSFTLADREDVLLPCRAACPAAIDVPTYIRAIAQGESGKAFSIIRESVPFPKILGMVCHHPCEDLCRRAEVDEPVAICDLKRFASETGEVPGASPPPPGSGKRVAVVGSGPAGLTAAFYLTSKGHKVTVFEREAEPGGMLKYAIPDYRLPEATLLAELDRVLTGVELRTSSALGVDFHMSDLEDEGFDAVFLSTGVGLSRRLEIPGVESPLVRWGVEFLKEVNTGGRPQMGESVAVVGGGNVAVDVALSCVRTGSRSVSLVCLECESEMPAFAEEIETAREEGIRIMNGWGPKEILLKGDRPVELLLRRCTQVFNEQGNFSPVYDDTATQTLPVDSVVMAIGQDTDPSLLSSPGMPSQQPSGLFVTEGTRTDRSGVFAGGDGVRGPSSVIEAVADGRRAAEDIDVFLGGDGILITAEVHTALPRIGRVEGFGQMKRTEMRCADPIERKNSFDVIKLGYSSEEAGREASRCLQCDLRLRMESVVLPPEKWMPLQPDTVEGVPEKEGVYQLADDKKKVLKITGTQNLKTSLEQEVEDGTGALFCFDEDPMYTKRESELIQQYLQKYGELPGAGEGDLDDLF